MNCVVLGFISGQNKNGSFYTVLNVTTQFTQYELKNGAQGKKVMNIYVPFQIPNLAVGCSVCVVYAPGFNDKAVVTDVKILNK